MQEDSLDGVLNVLTCACFGCSSLFPCLNNTRIFIHSSAAVLCLSGFDKRFLCLYVLLAGILVGLVKLALVDGFKHHLHMTEELLWSSLVEDGDDEVHVVGHLDFHGVVLAFDDILFRGLCDGWLDTTTPLTLLRLQSFRDRFGGRHLD